MRVLSSIRGKIRSVEIFNRLYLCICRNCYLPVKSICVCFSSCFLEPVQGVCHLLAMIDHIFYLTKIIPCVGMGMQATRKCSCGLQHNKCHIKRKCLRPRLTGCFLTGTPPKSSKYKKVNLGQVYLGRSTSLQIHLTQVFHTLTFQGGTSEKREREREKVKV